MPPPRPTLKLIAEACITEGKTLANFRILSGIQPAMEDAKFGSLGDAFWSLLASMGQLFGAIWARVNYIGARVNYIEARVKYIGTIYRAFGIHLGPQSGPPAPQSWYSKPCGPPNGGHFRVI